ncbi:hypothetical protein QJQ45_003169 [Haematococcus lacustris]|nr:hypothetical protein QJQ45_003169 [Haematococcus lacustris]
MSSEVALWHCGTVVRRALWHCGTVAPALQHAAAEDEPQLAIWLLATPFAVDALPRRPFSSSSPALQLGGLDALTMMLSPSQLGAQLWESGHALTGLPWWASIPLTTLGARALSQHMSAEQSRSLGRLLLVRAIYQQLQSRQQLPSLYWWASNAVVQTTVFLSLSSALARMAAALWPGLTSEGPWLLQDLSSPPLYLATLSTPFGTLGSLLPLAIVLTYLRALDAAPSAQVPGILAALRLVALPYYCSALLQPNAVLLYWLTHSAASSALQLQRARQLQRSKQPGLATSTPPPAMGSGPDPLVPAQSSPPTAALHRPAHTAAGSASTQSAGPGSAPAAAGGQGLVRLAAAPPPPPAAADGPGCGASLSVDLSGHSATTDVQLLLGLGSLYLGYPTLRGTAAAGGGTRGGSGPGSPLLLPLPLARPATSPPRHPTPTAAITCFTKALEVVEAAKQPASEAGEGSEEGSEALDAAMKLAKAQTQLIELARSSHLSDDSQPDSTVQLDVHRINITCALMSAAEYAMESAAELMALGEVQRESGTRQPGRGEDEYDESTSVVEDSAPSVNELLEMADTTLQQAQQEINATSGDDSDAAARLVSLQHELSTLRARYD